MVSRAEDLSKYGLFKPHYPEKTRVEYPKKRAKKMMLYQLTPVFREHKYICNHMHPRYSKERTHFSIFDSNYRKGNLGRIKQKGGCGYSNKIHYFYYLKRRRGRPKKEESLVDLIRKRTVSYPKKPKYIMIDYNGCKYACKDWKEAQILISILERSKHA